MQKTKIAGKIQDELSAGFSSHVAGVYPRNSDIVYCVVSNYKDGIKNLNLTERAEVVVKERDPEGQLAVFKSGLTDIAFKTAVLDILQPQILTGQAQDVDCQQEHLVLFSVHRDRLVEFGDDLTKMKFGVYEYENPKRQYYSAQNMVNAMESLENKQSGVIVEKPYLDA